MTSEKEEMKRLLTPSLYDVRNHQIGKFLDYSLSIHKSKKEKAIFRIKTATHPKWFEQKETTVGGVISISQRAADLLKNDGKISRRWSRIRRWRKKENNGGEKGEWYYRYRTPKKTVWIASSKRTNEQKGKAGRKSSGLAYKVRREVWRSLAAHEGYIGKLLKGSHTFTKERKPMHKVSLRIPNLSKAIEEIIIEEIWPHLGIHTERIVNEWFQINGLKTFLQKHGVDEEIREKFSKGILEKDERNKIIALICQKNWRAILARWIELRVFSKQPLAGKDAMAKYANMRQYSIEPSPQNQSTNNQGDYDMDCEPYCIESIPQYDAEKRELWCTNCGLVAGSLPVLNEAE